MGEDAAQAERSQQPGADMRQEIPWSPSPVPSSTPSPSLHLGSPEEAIRDKAQVNAVTVLTLLNKLVDMLGTVQDNQHKMEQRQISLEGSVKGIQNDLTKLSKYQASTSNTVSKLLEKSRKVSAHTRVVKERLEQQNAQVKRLETNHAQLLRRNHFKVLIFQEENEIPASVFAKRPASSLGEGSEAPAEENKTLEDTLHTVDLSSEDDEGLADSADEKLEASRAEKIKRSSLQKVDSLKKAFSRQNIEKKMNQLGTKIVSVERREKIKKSLASNHQKIASGKSSPFKMSPLSFGRKKVREGASPAEPEERRGSDQLLDDHEDSSVTEGPSEASLGGEKQAEGEAEGEAEREAPGGRNSGRGSNVDLAIVEDEEEEGAVGLEDAQKMRYGDSYPGASEETEEEPRRAAVLQGDQTA
ncbi:caveolae-associated protein 2 [Echinops telfairi]|uniref:Caveolae-associated protein 2 n=1 Tax=Echinops telfairi TaxID=9371 RepID=A0ABM0IJQ4_ECHTE|nr:caveolae-associated protein 2 [Echinops telfairi]